MVTLNQRITKLEQQIVGTHEPRFTWAEIIQSLDNPDVLTTPQATPSRHGQTLLEWDRAFSIIQHEGINYGNA